MDERDPHTEVTFHLSKDEIEMYDLLCREVDVDPAQYRSGQKVTAPAFHWVELAAAYTHFGAERVADSDMDQLVENAAKWDEMSGDILGKFAKAADDAGVREAIVVMAEDDPRLDKDIDKDEIGNI